MFTAFDRNIVKNRLNKLDNKAQLVFGAICCERLIPNYLAFALETRWGDILPLRRGMNLVWDFLDEKQFDTTEVNEIITLCELAAPNSDDFQSLYSTSAQDACFAICELLDYLLDVDVNKIVQILIFATDTVDLYVQVTENYNPNSPDIERKIMTHRLMQRELEEQENNLKSIETADRIDNNFIRFIRPKPITNRGTIYVDAGFC